MVVGRIPHLFFVVVLSGAPHDLLQLSLVQGLWAGCWLQIRRAIIIIVTYGAFAVPGIYFILRTYTSHDSEEDGHLFKCALMMKVGESMQGVAFLQPSIAPGKHLRYSRNPFAQNRIWSSGPSKQPTSASFFIWA